MKDRSIAATANSFFTLINPFVFTFLISLWFASLTFAEQSNVFTLGEIGDQKVSEGELLNFNIQPPSYFGPDVKWTVTGFPGIPRSRRFWCWDNRWSRRQGSKSYKP